MTTPLDVVKTRLMTQEEGRYQVWFPVGPLFTVPDTPCLVCWAWSARVSRLMALWYELLMSELVCPCLFVMRVCGGNAVACRPCPQVQRLLRALPFFWHCRRLQLWLKCCTLCHTSVPVDTWRTSLACHSAYEFGCACPRLRQGRTLSGSLAVRRPGSLRALARVLGVSLFSVALGHLCRDTKLCVCVFCAV